MELPAAVATCGTEGLFADPQDPLAARYRILCDWWRGPESDRGAARRALIKTLWLDGYYEVLELLPLPEAAR